MDETTTTKKQQQYSLSPNWSIVWWDMEAVLYKEEETWEAKCTIKRLISALKQIMNVKSGGGASVYKVTPRILLGLWPETEAGFFA